MGSLRQGTDRPLFVFFCVDLGNRGEPQVFSFDEWAWEMALAQTSFSAGFVSAVVCLMVPIGDRQQGRQS